MNLEQFQNTRKWTYDISAISNDEEHDSVAGYIYADSFWIAIIRGGAQYHALVGNDEITDPDLAVVEQYLWDNFCKWELEGD